MRRTPVFVLAASVVALLAAGCSSGQPAATRPALTYPGIHKVRHVVMITQENRSFDSYFGTFPGADGIAMRDGKSVACLPARPGQPCRHLFVDHADVNGGGPHGYPDFKADFDGGRMDGFLSRALSARHECRARFDPECADGAGPDVLGYHTGSDIPNYWAYARRFVLQDHFFEAVDSWSLPEHLYEVSGWSAECADASPASCRNDPALKNLEKGAIETDRTDFAWTDLTYLMHRDGVSWGYYVKRGHQPDCSRDGAVYCKTPLQAAHTPGKWNPLPDFETVHQDHQLSDIRPLGSFYAQARRGTLPAVSWVVPSGGVSEHPPARVSAGQSYVTSLVDAVMRGPDWRSTAIFLNWDDWGGFYDSVPPPKIDPDGYGLRVPALVISPYAKAGYVDHQTLSTDAYLAFVEDDFLGGARLNPRTDGRPDPRPDVRETTPGLGSLLEDFDFARPPRRPLLLPVHPHTTLTG